MSVNFRVPTLLPVAEFHKAGTGTPPAKVLHTVYTMRGRLTATGTYSIWQSLDNPVYTHPEGSPVENVMVTATDELLV